MTTYEFLQKAYAEAAKQLQEQEHENAELKTEIQRLYQMGEFKTPYEELLAENAELRKSLDSWNEFARKSGLSL